MRWMLGIEYEGTAYHGWQIQQNTKLNTIQHQIESALSQIANHPVTVTCAGRTDQGVHALEQIVHFDTVAERKSNIWVSGANRFLPSDIRVQWAQPVSEQF